VLDEAAILAFDKHDDERLHAMYVESSDPSMNRFHSRSPVVKLDKGRWRANRPVNPCDAARHRLL
jgi:hypothetical protein